MSVCKYTGKRGTPSYVVIELGHDPADKPLQEITRENPVTGVPMLTKTRAQEIEREEVVKRHRGTAIEPSSTRFGDFLDSWMAET
jgi:hypothetical protein